MIDADGSGSITFEELNVGLKKLGSGLMENEIRILMDAVCLLISRLFRTCLKNTLKFSDIFKHFHCFCGLGGY